MVQETTALEGRQTATIRIPARAAVPITQAAMEEVAATETVAAMAEMETVVVSRQRFPHYRVRQPVSLPEPTGSQMESLVTEKAL